jgi:small G protein signaling modulator 3
MVRVQWSLDEGARVVSRLASAGDSHADVALEIEKDVGPLNIFFGGDGAGVVKLCCVLTA